MGKYWYDNLPNDYTWHSLWYGYIMCGNCSGIRIANGLCPVCKAELPEDSIKIKVNGIESKVEQAYMGAEDRYEDYVYLDMLEYEWRRPISDFERFNALSEDKRPSPRAIMVLVFWTYFETRIERLMEGAMKNIPKSIQENLLKRYQSISSRTSELYKVLFGRGNSYYLDLNMLGFQNVNNLLNRIQERRNRFMHGEPEAIDDELVEEMVDKLKLEHESWICVYNLRVANTS